MTRRTDMLVTSCAVCPFYERGAFSAVADLVLKREIKTGTCKFRATMPWPFQRVHVDDETKIPEKCPLREGEAVVRLA